MIGGKYDLSDRYGYQCTYTTLEDNDFVRCSKPVAYWHLMCAEHGKDFAGVRCNHGFVHEPEMYYYSGSDSIAVDDYLDRLETPDVAMNRRGIQPLMSA